MSIPNQMPQFVAAARAGALQALALQVGQLLDGKVIGPAPNGGMQVQIGDQMLNLVLPTLTKAGDTLKLEVQGSGAQLKLALLPSVAPGASSPPPTAPVPMLAGSPSMLLSVPEQFAGTAMQAQQQAVPSPAPMPATIPASGTTIVQMTVPTQVAAMPGSSSPPAATPVPVASPLPAPVTGSVVLTHAMAAEPPAPPPNMPPQSVATPAMPQPGAAPSLPASVPSPVPQQQFYSTAPKAAAAQFPVTPPPIALAPNATATAPGQSAATSATPVTPALQSTTAPIPASPQAAVAQMVQTALPRQDGITGLMVALTSIAGKVALPEPVIRAAQQVLANRVGLDGGKLDASALQKAVLRSGVFQEASLVRAGSPVPTAQVDIKSALLSLRQTLTTWLGPQAPLAAPAQIAPPIRGQAPRARAVEAAPVDPSASPEEVGRQLLERTDAALSRVRLHQSASLPDPVAKTADWSMDLPVLVGQQQALLHIQIHRDEQGGSESRPERGWQMRFAMNLHGMGEVGAQVSLRGGAMGVMLWATERATSEALESDMASLRETLASVGLRPGAVIVRHGEPPAPPPAPSGHFVDAST